MSVVIELSVSISCIIIVLLCFANKIYQLGKC